MLARLVPISQGVALSGPIPLQRPVLLVGRHPDCDVRLDLPQISRRHCCIALAYDRLSIRDLGSRNGVRVNGRLVEEARLHPGDEVAIGQLIYRLEESAPAVQAAPAIAAEPAPAFMKSPDLPELGFVNDPDDDLIPVDDDLFPSA
jgi:predicted component of type VI protein secretion system